LRSQPEGDSEVIYTFKCACGATTEVARSIVDGPPPSVRCEIHGCGGRAVRDWQADAPMIDTSACKDHSEVRADKRVRSAWDRSQSPEKVEAGFKRHIAKRRSEIREAGGQRGAIKQTHAVPAHLFHGKIKESGDKNYWNDPKNLNRHTECKVDG
jgi:hypothetical protein